MAIKKKSGKKVSHLRSFAAVEAQFAALEAQIALLQKQNAVLQVQSFKSKMQSGKTLNFEPRYSEQTTCGSEQTTPCTLNSPDELAAPPYLNAKDNETATLLQGLFDELQTVFHNAQTLVPEVGKTVLPTATRRRMRGSGVRRYGFIDQVSDLAADYPRFWPEYVDHEGKEPLKTIIREIEVLRGLLVFFETGARNMQDLLLIRGDAAFRIAGIYYMSVRTAARRQVPGAEALFSLLNSFWRKRRSSSDEPTQKETLRNFKALLNGTREGEMFIENESDGTVKGKRTIIDKTRKKRKMRENAEIREESEQ